MKKMYVGFDVRDLEVIDRVVISLQAKNPGIEITRSAAIRALVHAGAHILTKKKED